MRQRKGEPITIQTSQPLSMGKDDNEFGLKTQLEQLGLRNRHGKPAASVVEAAPVEIVAFVTEDSNGKLKVENVSPLTSLLDLDGTGRINSLTNDERKKFMTQFKTYSKKNDKIKTIKQYVKYIMKHPKEFVNKTVNRAKKYA